ERRRRGPGRVTALVLLVAAGWGLAPGCGVYRGMPGHGGGKRFDEEQIAVAGAIRRAVADMDLGALRGKSVVVNIESMSHNGGGSVTFPGVNALSVGAGVSGGEGHANYPYAPRDWVTNDSRSENLSLNANASVNPVLGFNSFAFGSDSDLNYLRAAVVMKAQHADLAVVPANPDAVLFVLVDVLGINRSRSDNIFRWQDTLEARCELTYYALDAKTNVLVFRARRTCAVGCYEELSSLGATGESVDRRIESRRPTRLPVDGEGLTRADGVRVFPAATAPVVQPTANGKKQAEYIETQVRNAEFQIQVGDLAGAESSLSAIRAIDPRHPNLADLEAKLQRRRSMP
ncbi:MAG: hypothetical protein NTV86_10630, partial [Planctomycetota bacterium]|nr:hypothetical protein [Planctomycetota bacterium]